jgi:hypothetical protein
LKQLLARHILYVFRIDPFGMLRPDFACLRPAGRDYAQAGASNFILLLSDRCGKWQESDITRSLHRDGYLPLVLCTVS